MGSCGAKKWRRALTSLMLKPGTRSCYKFRCSAHAAGQSATGVRCRTLFVCHKLHAPPTCGPAPNLRVTSIARHRKVSMQQRIIAHRRRFNCCPNGRAGASLIAKHLPIEDMWSAATNCQHHRAAVLSFAAAILRFKAKQAFGSCVAHKRRISRKRPAHLGFREELARNFG